MVSLLILLAAAARTRFISSNLVISHFVLRLAYSRLNDKMNN
jgi:hypothetical protein